VADIGNVRVTGGNEWAPILRNVGAAGNKQLHVGILEGASYASDAESKNPPPVASVAFFHEFGCGNNPERSFLRRGLEEHGGEWADALKTLLSGNLEALVKNPDNRIRGALKITGQTAANDCRGYIRDSLLAPLTQERIEAKIRHGQPSNATIPLAFTGALNEAIKSEVVDG
jgi:hypothetical protein